MSPENFYKTMLHEHGPTAKGVGWRNLQEQWTRFDVMFEGLELGGRDTVSLLDVGCGYGELLEWLWTRNPSWAQRVSYYGIDSHEAVIDAARDRYPNLASRFAVADVRNPPGEPHPAFGPAGFDVVIGSGVLSYYHLPEQMGLVGAMWDRVNADGHLMFNAKRKSNANDEMLLARQANGASWSMRSDYGFNEVTYRISRKMRKVDDGW